MKKLAVAAALTALALAGCDDDRGTVDGGPLPPRVDANLPPGVDGGGTPGVDAGTPPGTDAGSAGPTGPLVDPDCTDGMFREALPNPDADLSDLEAGYSPSNPTAFIDAVLQRRYSSGYQMVVGGRSAQDCVGFFLRDTSSPSAIYGQLGTVVHECGHFYDNQLSRSAPNTYYINDAPLQLTCRQGDTTSRGGVTFARSRIRNDTFSSARPPCDGGSGGCDFYADVYLDGDPDDGTFEGGDQGFNMLFEELVQYVNSLATSYAFTDELNTGGRSSQKDGLLTFMWYLERYLYMARNDYPAAYDHLVNGDGGCWRDAILQVWGRANLYLDATASMPHLGINDAELSGLVETPELLGEIQRLRDAAGCGG